MLTKHPSHSLTHATTDSEVILMWLSDKSQKSQETYLITVEQFFTFVSKPLVEITLDDLWLWGEGLKLRYAANSIKVKVSAIKSLFSYAWKIGYLVKNPASAISAGSGTDALYERILEQSDVIALIEATNSLSDRLLLTLIYCCGLRISEALGIDWKDLKPRGSGGQALVEGKGKKVRTVLINQRLWDELSGLPKKGEAVFATIRGNRKDRHRVHRMIKEAASRCGIDPHVSAHWLRHAHAVHSLDNGCKLDVLMRSLGHSSLTVTSKYLHARPSEGSSQFIDI